MTYVHQLKDRTREKIETKCGLMFDPRKKVGRLETALWDNEITCPTCRGEK